MTRSSTHRFVAFVTVLAAAAQPAFAGGHQSAGGGHSIGGGSVIRQPVAVPRAAPVRSPMSPAPGPAKSLVPTGNAISIPRAAPSNPVLPQSTSNNTSQIPRTLAPATVTTANRVPRAPVPADSTNRVPRTPPSPAGDQPIGNAGSGTDNTIPRPTNGTPGNHESVTLPKPERPETPEIQDPPPALSTSPTPTPTTDPKPSPISDPPPAGRHIDPLPGEQPVVANPGQRIPRLPLPLRPGTGGQVGNGIFVGIVVPPVGRGYWGLPAAGSTAGSETILVPSQTVIPEVAPKDMLDVELLDVRLVEAGSMERKAGPRYRLTYRNNGAQELPKLLVTVAVDAGNEMTPTAEFVTVEAPSPKPGKTLTVDVRLPVETLSMSIAKDGKPAPFGILVAAIDSDESLAETNEENNLKVFARDSVKSVKD